MKLVLVAAHRGPFEALKPVARAWRGSVAWILDGTAAAAARAEGLAFSRWDGRLRGAAAVLRGTSELPDGRNPEAAAARAASRAGVPVFALEDFPGNYRGSLAGLAGLFVEFQSGRKGALAFGNPRYERMPRPTRTRAAAREPVVLWIGQPDGARCRRTLAALAPALRAAGAFVLLRAHPRDAGSGYGRLLKGVRVLDAADPRAALAAADLAVTQFSSMAVEAAAAGVPALFVLLPGAGADYLRERTGRKSLPWCENGAAFLLARPGAAKAVLERALFDRAARRSALAAMRRHFAACRGSAGRIAAHIRKELLSRS